jgi:hypothetical protein
MLPPWVRGLRPSAEPWTFVFLRAGRGTFSTGTAWLATPESSSTLVWGAGKIAFDVGADSARV